MRWGILGTGTIARKFAQTLQAMAGEGEVLAAVGSRSRESAEAFAKEFGAGAAYGSYEELAECAEAEIIYIATPNSLHYENAKLCLENGKHVLCEKPFTLRPEEAEALYALAKERGLFLAEGLWICHLPLYRELRRQLESGAIGEVLSASCSYGFVAKGARRERKFDRLLGGGALLDIGVYNLGFLWMAFGEMPISFDSEVKMSEHGTDCWSRLLLHWEDGGEGECVTAIGEEIPRLAVIRGTKGEITIPDFQHAEAMTVSADGEKRNYAFPFDINGFEYEIREAGHCVQAGKSAGECWPPEASIALTSLVYDIRRSWGMAFPGDPA